MLGFVIAMQNEADALLSVSHVTESFTVCNKKAYRAEYEGTPFFLIVSGVGKVNAACATQLAVSVYGCDKIVNFGLAGSLYPHTEVAKVYEISHASEYDFDLAQLNGTPVGTLNEFTEPFLPLNRTNLYPARKLGTGDRFNDSPVDYRFLTETLGADIRDMEGAAIVHSCIFANVPVFAYKVISDVAGSGSTTDQYLANTKKALAHLTTQFTRIFSAL